MAHDTPIDLVIPGAMWSELHQHLFRDDCDEHGAVIAAGIMETGRVTRLLARRLLIAADGVDYVPGERGYRMLTADFVRDCALFCRDERLAYLAVHNHGGHDSVAFSSADMRSHERGYPALRDILGGPIVGGVVFAEKAVAGDLWLADRRAPLRSAVVLGETFGRMFPSPRSSSASPAATRYHRQARMFGGAGQQVLAAQRVGVVGLGGVGSIVCELLARLGVGNLVLVDPDALDETNLSRVVNSNPSDVGRSKVEIARRALALSHPGLQVDAISKSIVEQDVARALVDCDALFLAADTMQARLVFNAIVHQYLIPGFQIGSKIALDRATKSIETVFSVVRTVTPDSGCLWCNGLISSDRLAEEALSDEERRAQRYVDDIEVVAPSVVTVNSVGASYACNDYLMRIIGLRHDDNAVDSVYFEALTGTTRHEIPRKGSECIECGSSPRSRFARGDGAILPTRSA